MNLNKSPAPAPTPASSHIPNVLARDVEIEGTLTFDQELIFDGKLEGEILSDGHLTIGKSARIEGNVLTKTVVMHGAVTGNITVTDRCEIKASATLIGDLAASRIHVEDGATFIGKSEVTMNKPTAKTPEAPRASAKPAAAPALELSGKR